MIEGLLLDMDGVLVTLGEPVPGAAEVLAHLRAAGVVLCVLTNTTSRSRSDIGRCLRDMGMEIADDHVLTAAVSAAAYVRTAYPGNRVFVLGAAQPEDLRGLHLVGLDDDPQVVLLAGADPSFAFDALNQVYRLLLRGVPFVAMHRSLSWLMRAGECLDLGAYLIGLERASGREAVVTGKPAAPFFAAGLRALGLPAARVAMVGDDLENDVFAAQAAGITGIWVRTATSRGVAVATQARRAPDHVVASIVEVPRAIGR
jgi:HAD superfamily hydrolase (TIGR01458 family)